MDDTTTLADLRAAVAKFVSAREWEQYHTPKNLAMSIAIEVAELQEHFQWLTPAQCEQVLSDETIHDEIADELADIIIYCLSFANQADIDVSAAVTRKLDRNEDRFPIDRVRGRLG